MNAETANEPVSLQLSQGCLMERPDILFCMCRIPGSPTIYCGSSDFNVYGLNLTRAEPQQAVLAGHRSYVSGVARTQDGQLVTSSWDRQLIWWDPSTGRLVRRVQAHTKWVRRVIASPSGRILASVADDMVCRLWDARTGNLRLELRGHDPMTPQHFHSMLQTCAYSPDGMVLATGDKIGHIVVWNVETGEAVATVESPEIYTWDAVQRRRSIGGIRSLAFSPDGRLLAVGGVAKIDNVDGLGGKALVQVYDWRTGKRTHKFEHDEKTGIVECLQFARGGQWLLGAGGAKKGLLLFMDLDREEYIHTEEAPMHIHEFDVSDGVSQVTAVGHRSIATWAVA